MEEASEMLPFKPCLKMCSMTIKNWFSGGKSSVKVRPHFIEESISVLMHIFAMFNRLLLSTFHCESLLGVEWLDDELGVRSRGETRIESELCSENVPPSAAILCVDWTSHDFQTRLCLYARTWGAWDRGAYKHGNLGASEPRTYKIMSKISW